MLSERETGLCLSVSGRGSGRSSSRWSPNMLYLPSTNSENFPRFVEIQQNTVRGRTAADRTTMAAWWARLSPKSCTGTVSGALLVAPEGTGLNRQGFVSAKMVLPFPSIVVGADDETQRLGVERGSRLIDGPLLTAAAAPTGRLRTIIERFTSAVVERNAEAGYRIFHAIGDG